MKEFKDLSFDEILKKAKDYEEKGDIQKAIFCYNIALSKKPDCIDIYSKLLEYYLNDPNPKKAIKILLKLISIDKKNPEYYKKLVSLLLEHNNIEKAKLVSEKAYKITGERYFKDIFAKKEEFFEVEQIKFDDTTINLLYNLFNAREGVYARQWKKSKDIAGYIPVYEPLSEKVIKNHLLGNITIGLYQVRIDNTVNWMVFDIDIAKFALKDALSNDDKWKELQSKLNQQAKEIETECAKFNIPTYLEDSGFKGRHCWIFFSSPIQAKIAKKFGEVLITNIKKISPEIVIEVFPKQSYVKKEGLGNLVKMPLGIHLKTGKRSYFYDDRGKIVNLNDYLKNIKRVSKKELVDYLSYYKIKETYDADEERLIKPGEKIELPIYVENYIPENDEEFQYILYKCPVINEIYKKALNENEITSEEMIVIIHTLGYLENGVNAVNYILSKCYNIKPENFLKSRLKGNPISCPKIRKKLPEITSRVDCNCNFPENLGMYPTPILHLKTIDIDKAKFIKGEIDLANIQIAIEEYFKIKKQFYELGRLLAKYEEKFSKLFEDAGINEIITPVGKLIKIEKDGKKTFMLKI